MGSEVIRTRSGEEEGGGEDGAVIRAIGFSVRAESACGGAAAGIGRTFAFLRSFSNDLEPHRLESSETWAGTECRAR
jgi:hypothetical protein